MNDVYVCGDIHGDYNVITNFLVANELSSVSIIVAGDFGVGFKHLLKEASILGKLNEKLKKHDCSIFAVRGNHDDPSYFNGHTILNLSRLKFVKDYDVLNLNDHNILCVGGAVSIDRTMRNRYNLGRGRDWWVDEMFVYDNEKAQTLRDIDIVVTHSAPNIAYPYTKIGIESFLERDLHLKSDVDHERAAIKNLYDKLIENNKIDRWYYGHFHLSKTSYFNTTKFIALDINEIQKI